jgi:hypothetical protein
MDKEPALIIGALDAAVVALIGVAALVFDIESDLVAALVVAASAIVVLAGAVLTRARVTPVD